MTSPTPQQPKSPKKEDKESWNNQLAAIAVKAIATGGLGGVGVFVASLKSSDLPTLAVGGIIGGGIAPIAAQLWNPIGKKLGKAAGSGGEAFANSAESRFQRWRGNLSDIEQKYLDALRYYSVLKEKVQNAVSFPLGLKFMYPSGKMAPIPLEAPILSTS